MREAALEEAQDVTEEYFETCSWHSDFSSDYNEHNGNFSSPKRSPILRKEDFSGSQLAVGDGPQMNSDGEELMVPIGSKCSMMNLDSNAVLEETGFSSVSHTSVFIRPEGLDPQRFAASRELELRVEDNCCAVILDISERDEAVNRLPFNLQSNAASEGLMDSDVVVASRDLAAISSSKCLRNLDASYSKKKGDALEIITGEEQCMALLTDDFSVVISDDSYHHLSLEVIPEGAGLPSISHSTSEETLTLTDRREAEPWLEHTPDLSTDDGRCTSPISSPDHRNLDIESDGSSLEEAGLSLMPQTSISVPDLIKLQRLRILEKKPELTYRRTSEPELNRTSHVNVEITHSDHEIISSQSSPNIRYQDSSHLEEKHNGLEMHMGEEELVEPLTNYCKKIRFDNLGNAEIVNRLSHEEAGLPSICQASMSSSHLDKMINDLEIMMEPLEDDSTEIILDNSEYEEALNASCLNEAGFSFISEVNMSSKNILTAPKKTLMDRRKSTQKYNAPDLDVVGIFSSEHAPVLTSIETSEPEEKIDSLEMNTDEEQLLEPLERERHVIILDYDDEDGSSLKIFSKEAGVPFISQASIFKSALRESQYFPSSGELPALTFRHQVASIADLSVASKGQMDNCSPKCSPHLRNLENAELSHSEIKNDGQQMNSDGDQQTVPLDNSAVIVEDPGNNEAANWSSLEGAGLPSVLHSNTASKNSTDSQVFASDNTSKDHSESVLPVSNTLQSGVASRDPVESSSPDHKNLDVPNLEIKNDHVELKTDTDECVVLWKDTYSAVFLDDLSCIVNPSSLEILSKTAALPFTSQASVSDSDLITDQTEAVLHLDNSVNLGATCKDQLGLSSKSSLDLRNLDGSHLERKNNGPEMNMEGVELMEPLARECRVIILNDDADGSSFKIFSRESGLPALSQANLPDSDLIESRFNKAGEKPVVPLTGTSDAGTSDYLRCNEVFNSSSLEESGLSFISQTGISDASKILTAEETNLDRNLPSSKIAPDLNSSNSERKGTDEADLVVPLANNCNRVNESIVPAVDNPLSLEKAGLSSQSDDLEKNNDVEELTVPLDSNAVIFDHSGQGDILSGSSPKGAGISSMSNTDFSGSQLFTSSRHTLAPPDKSETEPYLENAYDLTAASQNEEQSKNIHENITASELELEPQIISQMVNTNMVEPLEQIEEAGFRSSEVNSNVLIDPSGDSKMFMDPFMDGCPCILYCDSYSLKTEGVTSLLKHQGQFSNVIINKERIRESSLAIKDCAEDVSSSLSYTNSFISESVRNEHTLDLDIDQTERQSNDFDDLEDLHFPNTCSGKEFTAISQKEQEVIYSDSSGYIDSCVMPSASKESQNVTFSSVQGNVKDIPGPAEVLFTVPLDFINIAKFTQQVQHEDQVKFEKVCAKEHVACISHDDYCTQEKSDLKHTPEPPCTLHSSALEQEVWNHSYPFLRDVHLNDFSNVSSTSASIVGISNSLDVDDGFLEKMYEIECYSTSQSSEFSQGLSLNGSGESKTAPFCPNILQSYPFIDVNTGVISDLEPIVESEQPQENVDTLAGEQKDLISSVNEDECDPVQREENYVIYGVSSFKGDSDKQEDVDVTTCRTNSYDGNDYLPNSASADQDFIPTNNEEAEDPSHSSIGSNSNCTGSIQIVLKEKETKNISAGKSSRFSRFTRIPSFRKSKRDTKGGSKVGPEAKISPEVGKEIIQTPNSNPTVDHWTKYEDQSTDVVGKALGMTSNGQIKTMCSFSNTQQHDSYSEQVQMKPVPDPLKKSKSRDNFRTKLALAQRSLSSFIDIRIGEKDNQQDSTNLNQESKSSHSWKKKSKEAEMIKRTLSLPGPHGAKSRRRLQSEFVSGITKDTPDIQGFQNSGDDLKMTLCPNASVSGAETEHAQRNTLSNGLVTNSDVFETVQSCENISGSLMHSSVSAFTNQPAPSWTRSLGSFEGLDTPTRPVTPKPQNPGVWSHRSSFRYPSKTVATSLCSLGEGPNLEGLSDNSRSTRLVCFDSDYLLEGNNTESQSQTSLMSINSANESEVSLIVFSVYVQQ